jgi:hypothetical protein
MVRWLKLIQEPLLKQTTETQKEFSMRHEHHTATKGMMDYYKDII